MTEQTSEALWKAMNKDIVLIKDSTDTFRHILTGSIKYAESWFNMNRAILLNGDKIIPYQQGTHEICQMFNISSDWMSNNVATYLIFQNGEQFKLPYTPTTIYLYHRDYDKVKQFCKGSDNTGWTCDYVKCNSCYGEGCEECNYQSYISVTEYQKRIKEEERRSDDEKKYFFNTPATKCTENDCDNGYKKEKYVPQTCDRCDGNCTISAAEMCNECNGNGHFERKFVGMRTCEKCNGDAMIFKCINCPECDGSGHTMLLIRSKGEVPCDICKGSGSVKKWVSDIYGKYCVDLNYFESYDFDGVSDSIQKEKKRSNSDSVSESDSVSDRIRKSLITKQAIIEVVKGDEVWDMYVANFGAKPTNATQLHKFCMKEATICNIKYKEVREIFKNHQ